jgi:hypothetical protein
MENLAPCYRHPRHVRIASCVDCTAWHLAVLAARRGARAERSATGLRLAA